MNDAEIKAKSDEIVRLCLVKWKIKNDDERILKFKEELPYFIKEFDDSSMPMIENLLQRFDYFSHENVNKRLVELYNRISEDYDLDPMLTAYSTVKSATGRINSSNDSLATNVGITTFSSLYFPLRAERSALRLKYRLRITNTDYGSKCALE